MSSTNNKLPLWVLIVSWVFTILELMVGSMMFLFPEMITEDIDYDGKPVEHIVQLWAVRQFALGFIFGFAALKRSASMLSIAYLFMMLMFLGDSLVGVGQKDTVMIISGIAMSMVSFTMYYVVSRKK